MIKNLQEKIFNIFRRSEDDEYTKASKELLESYKVPYKEIFIDKMGEDEEKVYNALLDYTSQKLLPNIFIGHKHIG